MRAITVLILVMVGLLVAIVAVQPRPAAAEDRWAAVPDVQASLERIRQRILLEAAIQRTSQRARGHPDWIEAEWFERPLPMNPWFDGRHPWIEIASEADQGREHPRCIVALEPDDGTFWYDPLSGVVRARVPKGLMDDQAIALYNAANGVEVDSILP